MSPATVQRIKKGRVEKGDPIALARLAGVCAAKKTPEMVLLCHQLRLESVEIIPRLTDRGVEVEATVSAHERTGVEMEALVAVTLALLNVWDAVKQYEKDPRGQYPSTVMEGIRVVSKVKSTEATREA